MISEEKIQKLSYSDAPKIVTREIPGPKAKKIKPNETTRAALMESFFPSARTKDGIDKLTSSVIRMWECPASFDVKTRAEGALASTYWPLRRISGSASPRLQVNLSIPAQLRPKPPPNIRLLSGSAGGACR